MKVFMWNCKKIKRNEIFCRRPKREKLKKVKKLAVKCRTQKKEMKEEEKI